ncbi:hypothetical protein IC762_28000 [Bradyrhizobium genosp. L]|uniref:hypothetical protein n=1 Tax=Bradyrhizobium genosp. L TaxID=83637 RepID=UPI0018A3276A|nr:hypothetical protein [Bradyrhizobium genosp. L]QPF83517.1 hypothetical protein IC762_28000 [Bradyrhizobium genosp. L]
MKRSRRVILKLMGSVVVGGMAVGVTPASARGRRHRAKVQPSRSAVSGGFGSAPRHIARYGEDDPSHGGS